MSDIRFGIIGCGNICRDAHAWSVKEAKGVVCAGVCDANPEYAKEVAAEHGFRVFASAEEMVASPDVDAVILGVPNYQHEPMFRLAAEHGKHILCEKPLTMSVELGEQMVALAKTHNIKTQMGLCTRFEPYVEAMMDHIRAGNVGDIYFAQAKVLRRRGAPTGWFGNKAKSGGGPLIDIGVHYIDVLWYMMGKPKPVRVKALNFDRIPNRHPKSEGIYAAYEKDDIYSVEDSSHGIITFENGASLMYNASWSINTAEEMTRMDLYGTKGGLKGDENGNILVRDEASGITETTLMFQPSNCYTNQLEAFARVIRGEEESRTPVEDGLQIQKMLNGLYRSAELGEEVEI